MTRTDPDLVAVCQLPPGPVEPSAESVRRTWHTLSARQAARRRRRWPLRLRRGLAVPVLAGALVAAVAAGTVAVLGGEDGAAPPVAAERGADIHTLDDLITLAEAVQPVTFRDGQVLHRRMAHAPVEFGFMARVATPGEPFTVDSWYDPRDLVSLRVERDGKVMSAPSGKQIAEAHARAAQKPSVFGPTPQWLASLPTDPAALRTVLLRRPERLHQPADHELFETLSRLFATADALVPPQARVSLYRLVARIPRLTTSEINLAGRRLIAVRQDQFNEAEEMLFDPTTGRVVGQRWTSTGTPELVWSHILWTHAAVDRVGRPG